MRIEYESQHPRLQNLISSPKEPEFSAATMAPDLGYPRTSSSIPGSPRVSSLAGFSIVGVDPPVESEPPQDESLEDGMRTRYGP